MAELTKQAALEMLRRLPDEVSFEDIFEAMSLLRKVEAGREDIRNGNTLTHEEVRHMLQRRFK